MQGTVLPPPAKLEKRGHSPVEFRRFEAFRRCVHCTLHRAEDWVRRRDIFTYIRYTPATQRGLYRGGPLYLSLLYVLADAYFSGQGHLN